tara:strand:+ start:227 stop:418 length:192 start_codon:yes stop_codon:yes gene_type:complete
MAQTQSGFTAKQTGNKLVITIANMGKFVGESKSGKNNLIATTRGAVEIGTDGAKLNLNLYAPV